jgi:hypothetical protein
MLQLGQAVIRDKTTTRRCACLVQPDSYHDIQSRPFEDYSPARSIQGFLGMLDVKFIVLNYFSLAIARTQIIAVCSDRRRLRQRYGFIYVTR